MRTMNFAIDTGGTFTDLVVDTGDALHLFKALTVPEDPVAGVIDVLGVAAEGLGLSREEMLGQGELLIHGTTHAINALVTGTTARTAFLSTDGHPDVLLFREGGRANPFDFSVPYPDPLVPRELTWEVPERIAADGTVVEALDEDLLRARLAELAAQEVEAVGVALLWSMVNPAHELRVGELLEEELPGVPYTLSHQLNPILREYRRASSTCIDASLKPRMTSYFGRLERRIGEIGFGGRVLIVTSQGGMLDAADVARMPIHSINSGPAMAPVAGRFYAREDTGRRTAIIADTGGTTFDVSLVRDGRIPRTTETWLGPQYQGHITGFPSVDVTSVGAGGGSIASVDAGGLLTVGPQSAGSSPGPACYGRGGERATVTDASAVLGYLDPEYFLGGAMELDLAAARAAIEADVAEPLGLPVEEAAAAVMRIATENMVHAIEEITVNQGIDPRDAVLVGGGGAAGLNLGAIAARLDCSEVIIPPTTAALSAAGALMSDLGAEFAATSVTSTADFDAAGIDAVLADLTARCREFAGRSQTSGEPRIEYSFDGRYPRQNWDLETPLRKVELGDPGAVEDLATGFHEMHQRVFAISEPEAPVHVTTWRARVSCPLSDVSDRPVAGSAADGPRGVRQVYFQQGGRQDATVAEVDSLRPGERMEGPAVLESPYTTVVVDPGTTAVRTDRGTLVLTIGDGGER